MDHYVEIRLLPDPEFEATVLMSALFSKLHRALAQRNKGDIGVSFPQAEKTLGATLRLHGVKTALEELMAGGWLKGMRDHITLLDTAPTPRSCSYRLVRRVQTKSSADRLRRRSVKKGWLSEDEAREKIPSSREQRLSHPFVHISSQSTRQKFRVFIDQSKELNQLRPGTFSSYGLSSEASVPWF